MSKINTSYIQVDHKDLQITIQIKPYFRNDTLQPIYIYDTVDENSSVNCNIITYYIRGISNQIYTVINNYYIYNILKKNYNSLLPDINKNFNLKPINL